jgi:hypothetical protein
MFRENEVRRGIALLDENAPGWRAKFNPDTLDMASTDGCTLAQAHGSYIDGVGWLGALSGTSGLVSVNLAVAHGFSLRGVPRLYGEIIDYAVLTETWKALVPETAVDELVHVEVRELVAV